jgi:hypothetical protein
MSLLMCLQLRLYIGVPGCLSIYLYAKYPPVEKVVELKQSHVKPQLRARVCAKKDQESQSSHGTTEGLSRLCIAKMKRVQVLPLLWHVSSHLPR